jgi:hypothetical protein
MNDIGAAIKDAVDHYLPADDRIEMVEMKAMTGVARSDQRRSVRLSSEVSSFQERMNPL